MFSGDEPHRLNWETIFNVFFIALIIVGLAFILCGHIIEMRNRIEALEKAIQSCSVCIRE